MATLQLPKISDTRRDTYRGLTLVLGCILFCNALAQKVSEIVSISGFLSEVNADNFLYVLCSSSAIGLAASYGQSKIIDRCDRLTLLKYCSLILGCAFLILRILYATSAPRWLIHGSFYLLSEQQFSFFPVVLWVFASDTIDRRQAKRIFPRLSAVGFVGNLAGIGIAAASPLVSKWFAIHSREFLTVDVGIYAVIFGILVYLSRRRRGSLSPEIHDRDLVPSATPLEARTPLPQVVTSSFPALYPLAVALLASISVEAIVEYRFFIVSSMTFQSMDSYQLFLSAFTLVRTLAYIVIQQFITERVLHAIALGKAFMILPICSLLSTVALAIAPGIWGSIAGFTFQKLPQYSIDETARKTLLGFVPRSIRGRLSLWADSYLVGFGTMFGCALVMLSNGLALHFGINQNGYLHVLLGIVLATIAIAAVWNMQSIFETSFLMPQSIRTRTSRSRSTRADVLKSDRELALITSRSSRESNHARSRKL